MNTPRSTIDAAVASNAPVLTVRDHDGGATYMRDEADALTVAVGDILYEADTNYLLPYRVEAIRPRGIAAPLFRLAPASLSSPECGWVSWKLCRRAPASSTTASEVRPALTPETFRARRLELGLSVERVAALLDVAPSAVESWEQGARPSWGWRYVEWRLTQSSAVASGAVIGQRRRLGMTQAQFAVALGVDVGTVSRWERGAATVTAPGMFWLAIEALKGVE